MPLALKKQQVFIQLYCLCGDVILGVDTDARNKWVEARQLFGIFRENPQLLNVTEEIWGITQIKFLGTWVRICRRPAVLEMLATLENGLMLIDVMEDAKIDLQWLSLFHEIIHLIRIHIGHDVRDHGGNESEEERIVDGYAFMLVTLLLSNDMTWLLETEDEEPGAHNPTSVSRI
jgi:hypothetical protein